jgi:prepilin signal peptidase PulO-like enzyme (type II secretory pathway)
MASLLGSVAGIALILSNKMLRKDYLPFGPYIALAAFINIFLPGPWQWLTHVDINRVPGIKILLDKLI